jgi:hypothetical protein
MAKPSTVTDSTLREKFVTSRVTGMPFVGLFAAVTLLLKMLSTPG